MCLEEYDKIEALISEMRKKSIALCFYTYNIWLQQSYGTVGSLDKMEQVFERIQLNTTIKPHWTTYSTMATIYIKFGEIGKALDCMSKIETIMTGQDRLPYHYLMSSYGSAGKKKDVYRVWNSYKASFINIPNVAYNTLISALVRVDDIEGAEELYDDWLSLRSTYDPRLGNLLLSVYVQKGAFSEGSIDIIRPDK
ncbi:hypothetical protein OROMI_009547 [Orobanche minor]